MKKILFAYFLLATGVVFAQPAPKPYGVLPTKLQLNWHEMEMYCLIHFGVDTYTNNEWGYGDENPAMVDPVKFDAAQIVGAAKAGGFKGVVIVAKHHDGFCLWPTKTTERNISKSPFRGGKGDMIKEYQLACQKLGMQMGLYVSPWDRNNPYYGKPEYIQIYRDQIKELYTNYGQLFMSWHDGANGGDGYYGGAKEVRKIDRSTYYDWPTTWAMIRKLQPTAAIFGDIGPDVRWVGNEEGHAGLTCWETYTPEAPDPGKEPANGYSKYQMATEGTLNGKYWLPAECDVPLRPGWFYHKAQDEQVKTPYQLLDLYYSSVGRGAGFDLGIAPDQSGLLNEHDVTALKKFGDILKETFAVNMAKGSKLTASNVRGNNKLKYGPAFLTDNDRYSYWATDDNVTKAQVMLDLPKTQTFNVIRLRENIKLGQRITSFTVEAVADGKWRSIANGTSIGANRLVRLPQNITTNKVRVSITGAEASIVLSDVGLFKEPVHLVAPLITRDKKDMINISTEAPVASIHYTIDGVEPTLKSPLYEAPFMLTNGGIIKARSFETGNKVSDVTTRQLGLSKAAWKVMGAAQGRNRFAAAIDDNEATIWSSIPRDSTAVAQFPQEIIIDMGSVQTVKAFTYLPRQDKKVAGIVDKYIFYTSEDGVAWKQVANGEFSNIQSNPVEQLIPLSNPVKTRYFKFSALHVVGGNGVAVAELGVKVN
jgi:alpha-L-fucosidase